MRMSFTRAVAHDGEVAVARTLREARAAGSMLDWFQFCEILRIMAATYAG